MREHDTKYKIKIHNGIENAFMTQCRFRLNTKSEIVNIDDIDLPRCSLFCHGLFLGNKF